MHNDEYNSTLLKKQKIKEWISLLGKRKADELRYKSLLNHAKTTRPERAQLEERIQMNEYCIEHTKEKILTLVRELPFSVLDILEECR